MSRFARIGLGVAGVLALGAVGLLGLGAWTFSGMGSVVDGQGLPGGATVVKDGYVSLALLPLEPGKVALVDAGNDPDGAAILAALSARGLGPDAVTAILLTHGHPDHVAACARFPNATTYALAEELPLLRGEIGAKGPLTRWFPPSASGCPNLTAVHAGDTIQLGAHDATVFPVPGHTDGSAAWLVDRVLYLGDSADAAADGTLLGAKWIFTDDPGRNRDALRALARSLEKADVAAVMFAHSGVGDVAALRIWAAAQR